MFLIEKKLKKMNESKMACASRKYSRKQIEESIAHWKKVLEDIESEEVIDIPQDESGDAAFLKKLDELFGGSVYEHFIPDGYEEIEGARRDLDDWDIHRVCLRDEIDEGLFIERLLEDFFDSVSVEQMSASDLKAAVEPIAEKVAEELIDSIELTAENCIHHGRYKPESYWRS